jgi:hypothetical protein
MRLPFLNLCISETLLKSRILGRGTHGCATHKRLEPEAHGRVRSTVLRFHSCRYPKKLITLRCVPVEWHRACA